MDRRLSFKSEMILSGFKVKKLYKLMCSSVGQEYTLTQNEMDILLFLSTYKEIDTAKELTQYLMCSKALICKSVDALIKQEYLIPIQDQQDRRCIHLKITQTADPVIEELNAIQQKFINIIYAGVTLREMKVLERVLYKMNQNIQEACKL
jgi:DNA-binding MarR family transcriptional regulator